MALDYSLKAGAGRGVIRFTPDILPRSKRETYTRILDDPCIRIVLLETEARFAFVAVELANIDMDIQAMILDLIQTKGGVPADQIFFHLNHVHSTPHGWPPFGRDKLPEDEFKKIKPFCAAITNAAEEALSQALTGLREAVIGIGHGMCRSCVVNRNVLTDEGWWLGSGESGPRDESIGILRLDDLQGQTIAILYIYNLVPSIFDYSTRDFEAGLTRTVSADIAGAASAYIEAEFPGAVAVYCTGAAGDTWPAFTAMYNLVGRGGRLRTKDLGDRAFVLGELLGERLGQQTVIAADAITCEPLDGPIRIAFDTVSFEGRDEDSAVHEMRPRREMEWQSCGEERTMEIPFFFLGNKAVFIGLHCQVGVRTVMRVQDASPMGVTGLLSFSTIGMEAPPKGSGGTGPGKGPDPGKGPSGVRKYMPERDAYERVEYCAQNSVVMPGSAEKLGDRLIEFLSKQ